MFDNQISIMTAKLEKMRDSPLIDLVLYTRPKGASEFAVDVWNRLGSLSIKEFEQKSKFSKINT